MLKIINVFGKRFIHFPFNRILHQALIFGLSKLTNLCYKGNVYIYTNSFILTKILFGDIKSLHNIQISVQYNKNGMVLHYEVYTIKRVLGKNIIHKTIQDIYMRPWLAVLRGKL